MANRIEIYRCEICGNIVEVLHGGVGTLVCCDKPMTLITANTVDASKEKHVPVISKTSNGYKVSVGSVPHPMEEKHYIEWISISDDDKTSRIFLKPEDTPEVEFQTGAEKITAQEYCNIHGLWKSEIV